MHPRIQPKIQAIVLNGVGLTMADPKNLLNYRSLARLHASGKEYGKAIKVYEQALAAEGEFLGRDEAARALKGI